MHTLKNHIQTAEKKWLVQLNNYCQKLFLNKKIISHDHTHHERVWEYSKEILYALNNKYKIDFSIVESCLISSFFHDIGLTETINESHGKESRKICLQYFEDNNLNKPSNFEDILYAIEKHDDKDYKLKNKSPDSILSVLCNADDLDAFGKIGVIRYTEIYLLRGINIKNLPSLIIKNLDKRFLNFEKTYRAFSDLYIKHKNRYVITRIFFEALQKEF